MENLEENPEGKNLDENSEESQDENRSPEWVVCQRLCSLSGSSPLWLHPSSQQ